MAEAVVAMARGGSTLRVAIVAVDPARQAWLSARMTELGHLVSDLADAEIVLSDGQVPQADIPAVVLGGFDSDVAGVLAADADPVQIDAALRAVAVGLSVRPAKQASQLFDAADEHEPTALLTPREVEVLVALSEGLSNKAAARRLDISQHTVKFHVESVFRKLGVTTRAEAVAKGLRRGLVHL
jgi:DNA-binding NarL/FixJ family response regulator